MKNKIAIMTWYNYNNYGGVLQAYALRKTIMSLENKSVDFVNYEPTPLLISLRQKLSFRHLIEVFWSKKYKGFINKETKEKFDLFRNNFFTTTNKCNTKRELFQLNNEYDKFICGSDQIWAPNLFDDNYFLNFVDNNNKKVAYAPSIGLNSIEDIFVRKEMKKLINDIPYLSIREKRGQEIIKELTGRTAEIVLDPTLLIDKNEWNSIFKLSNFEKKKYVLVYCLGDMKKAFKIAKKLHKDIIVIPRYYNDYHKYKKYCFIPDPVDFLKLIYNADTVITDSFHGTIFSINFNVPFITLKRFKDNKDSQNSRIYSILNMVKLQNRLYSNKEIKNEEINFSDANMIIQKKREESIDFLKNAIETKNVETSKTDSITNICTGCGACAACCPQKCISIELNEDGFYQYVKDNTRCTDCGICKLVCAQVKNEKMNLLDKSLYSFVSNDELTLKTSSSGGFAHEVSKWGIKNGYKVIGCTYDKMNHNAKHIIIDDTSKLYELSGSKYIQSNMYNALKDIFKLEKAIIIGTPCQVASIDNLLKRKKIRENFILIDLICHGVPTYHLWNKYLKEKKNIDKVRFRDKKYRLENHDTDNRW